MTREEATAILDTLNFTPGQDSTRGLSWDVREKIKTAILAIRQADQQSARQAEIDRRRALHSPAGVKKPHNPPKRRKPTKKGA